MEQDKDVEAQDNHDFDDSANALWSLYGKEAENYDKATIKDIKSDMDGLLIFVRSCSSLYLCLAIDRINGRFLLRLACILPSSPRSSSIVIRIYNQHPHNNRRSSRTNHSFYLARSPISFPLLVHSHPSLPICPSQNSLSVRQRLMSG